MAFMKTKKPPTILLSGRNLAIIVVVVVSGLSFALGYFVGRSTVINEVQVIKEDVRAEQPEPVPEPPEAAAGTEAVPEEDTGPAHAPQGMPNEDEMGRYLTDTEPPMDTEAPEYAAEPEEPETASVPDVSEIVDEEQSPEPGPSAGPERKHIVKPVPTKPKEKKVALSPSPSVNHGEKLYSMQVGAYIRMEDAEALKERLQRKGYPQVYIYVSGDPGAKIPYKVRVGKTYDKQEALDLGARIKAEENISGFLVIAN